MKLYNVEVTYHLVILSESQKDAEQAANYVARHEDDSDPITTASEIQNVSDLEKPWDANYRPWGERDPFDRTIGEILSANENMVVAQTP